MTDRRRAPLPDGYQFQPWRRPSENAAERLACRSGFTANVIEGDHFDTFHDKQAIESQLADCEPFEQGRDPGDEA